MIIFQRIYQKNPDLVVTKYNIHRLILSCLVVCIKMYCDDYSDNAFYAKIGGITTTEMNKLEIATLFLLEFDLLISRETYNQYLAGSAST